MISVQMTSFIIRILGNSLALYIANWFVPGFVINGGIKEYLMAGILLGLLNMIVRPVLKAFTFPIIILTLGIFILVLNALMLWIVDYIFDFVIIQNLWALAWATITVGIINWFIGYLPHKYIGFWFV